MIQEILDSITKRELLIGIVCFASGLGVKFLLEGLKKAVLKYLFGKKEKG